MTVYVVFIRDRITDPAEMETYQSLAAPTAAGRPIKPLAFYGPVETLEGPPVDGAVIFEFPTAADAHDWYDSPEYQAALKHRLAGSDYRVFMIDGVG